MTSTTVTPASPKTRKARPVSPRRDWKGTAARKGQPWNPELIGKVQGYPTSEDAFLARRAQRQAALAQRREKHDMTRRGVPDGFGGRRAELHALREEAAATAKRTADVMVRAGMLDKAEDQSDAALAALLGIAMDPAAPVAVRSAASRAFLAFVRPRPTTAGSVGVSAEGLLRSLGVP